MTSKVRIRLDDHLIIEQAGRGVIVYDQYGKDDIQEDVPTYIYSKAVYEDKRIFLEVMANFWDYNMKD
jgi:hypothetical protein